MNAEPSSTGKAISRAEALLTARRVLDTSERERAELAELEASRGMQLVEEASFSRGEETRTEVSV